MNATTRDAAHDETPLQVMRALEANPNTSQREQLEREARR